MARKTAYDWPRVLARLKQDEWYLLGKNLPKTLYEAIRLGSKGAPGRGITQLRGVEVQTRNTRRDENGRRTSDIYLRLRKEQQ